MGPAQLPQSIDVTGLSENAIRAVELYVAQLRCLPTAGVPAEFPSRQGWARAVQDWAESHPKRDRLADDSREAVYGDERDE